VSVKAFTIKFVLVTPIDSDGFDTRYGHGCGGSVSITAGGAGGGNADGGNIYLTLGSKAGSGAVGTLNITDGDSGLYGAFNFSSLSSNRVYTLPDKDGTVAMLSDIPSGTSVATSGEVDTGTNNTKFLSPLALAGSSYITSSAISNTAYSASWSADTTHAPSKDAVYNKIESLSTGGSTNHTVCWKAGGLLGYCSSIVGVDGTCTCN
jgi:hypothetical protein